jgi:hypothetical protein
VGGESSGWSGILRNGPCPARRGQRFSRISLILLAICSWIAAWPSNACADEGALAEALFRQGQSLMTEGKIDDACLKFEESQRLDPSTGTLLNLADCHEKQGKLAMAWNEFGAAVLAARRDQRADRVSFAQERIDVIEPKLSKLTLLLPSSHEVEGLQIELDKTKVGRAALGMPLPIDSGDHTLIVKAPGKQTWQSSFKVEPGPSEMLIPKLVDEVKPPIIATTSQGKEFDDQGKNKGSVQRTVSYVVGGLGVIGVGIGVGFGVVALEKNGQSNQNGCDGNDCDANGYKLRNEARQAGDISTVAFVAGGTLLASAVVLYFTAPHPAHVESSSLTWAARLNPVRAGGTLAVGATW